MLNKWLALVISLSFLFSHINAQDAGFHFGIKGGLTMANQNWNFGDRQFYLTNHVNFFVESLDPDDRGSLFAQIGLHNRGSAIRFNLLSGGFRSEGYNFKNISLLAAAKRKISPWKGTVPYYFAGVRAEYNVANNLLELAERLCTGSSSVFFSPPVSPTPEFINKFTYGISIGGGFEFSGTKFFQPLLEFTFSPDLSNQYIAAQFNTLKGVSPERRIRNFSIEVSLVLRFLREVLYED